MAISALNRTLPDWFTRIRTHQTVLPRFQRFEAWSHGNVAQLFNTILRDLPVGALLVLEIGADQPFESRSIQGAPESGERVTEHLLDGQQRLTALWRGMHNNYEDRTYFLHLSEDEETGQSFYVDSIARYQRQGDQKARPLWADDPAQQWKRRRIPLDICRPGEDASKRVRVWAEEAIPDRDERDQITDFIQEVRGKFATFNLPYLSLPVTTAKETALDVFLKMNTSAAPLTTYDIVVAQVEAGLGTSLHDLVADLKEACPEIEAYYPPEDLILYAGALLQERPPTNSSYLAREFPRALIKSWDQLVLGTRRAAAFLSEEHVYDGRRLPTDVVVPVLAALWAIAPESPDALGRARSFMEKYLWRSFFTQRYEMSTSSRAVHDFKAIQCLFEGGDTEPEIFDDAQYPLPAAEELMQAGWPKKKDRLGRAILAVALREGGLDLADGSPATRVSLAKREYHHIFPDAHLRRTSVSEDKTYLSLNCALVSWKTNRTISDKDPERYLAERRDGSRLGVDEIRRRLASHLVPYDEMVAGDYDAFLQARSSLVHAAMQEVCGAVTARSNS